MGHANTGSASNRAHYSTSKGYGAAGKIIPRPHQYPHLHPPPRAELTITIGGAQEEDETMRRKRYIRKTGTAKGTDGMGRGMVAIAPHKENPRHAPPRAEREVSVGEGYVRRLPRQGPLQCIEADEVLTTVMDRIVIDGRAPPIAIEGRAIDMAVEVGEDYVRINGGRRHPRASGGRLKSDIRRRMAADIERVMADAEAATDG